MQRGARRFGEEEEGKEMHRDNFEMMMSYDDVAKLLIVDVGSSNSIDHFTR